MWTDTIYKPSLMLNETVCRRNIQRMARKAQINHVRFRPHFKTHQSSVIGDWFRDAGVTAITVSSVAMAAYFAEHGWNDITIAFTVNPRQLDEINQLASHVKLGLLLETVETVQQVSETIQHPVNIWIDVDAGYHRTGVSWDGAGTILDIAQAVSTAPHLTLRGLLTHAGNTYKSNSVNAIKQLHDEVVAHLNERLNALESAGFAGLEISVGDTPACSVLDELGAVHEMRPGNFVFYDVMQHFIGSCTLDDIAVAVACPVIAKHSYLQQIVVYGGGVHLSKDSVVDLQGRSSFGLVALPTSDGWRPFSDKSYVKGLSQEHGLIHASDELLSQVNVGDVLCVLPVHSCYTANLLKQYRTLGGHHIQMAMI